MKHVLSSTFALKYLNYISIFHSFNSFQAAHSPGDQVPILPGPRVQLPATREMRIFLLKRRSTKSSEKCVLENTCYYVHHCFMKFLKEFYHIWEYPNFMCLYNAGNFQLFMYYLFSLYYWMKLYLFRYRFIIICQNSNKVRF